MRSEKKFFVQWHQPEALLLRPKDMRGRLVEVPKRWDDWEVPGGVWAELPPAFAYQGTKVIDNPDSEYWILQNSGWRFSVAGWAMWDVFDTYRVWWITSRVRVGLCQLREIFLRPYLDGNGYDDLQPILYIVSTTDWDRFPRKNQQLPRCDRFWFCRGREKSAGVFVQYDPWKRRRIARNQSDCSQGEVITASTISADPHKRGLKD